jgi:phosphatidylethanolamine-binding protein (PEBP) family uncharacterized protein
MRRSIAVLATSGVFAVVSILAVPMARAPDVFTLTSSAVQDNGTLAIKNACSDTQRSPNCVGENISPPLAWSNPPDGTKSFALLLFDPEGRAPAGVSHMVVYGIPADVKGFAEGELSKPSDKFVGGKSTMGLGVYFGPGTPPNTDWHPLYVDHSRHRPRPDGAAAGYDTRGIGRCPQGPCKGLGWPRHPVPPPDIGRAPAGLHASADVQRHP